MTKFNSLARARVIGPEGGAWGGGAGEGAAGVDVLVVSSSPWVQSGALTAKNSTQLRAPNFCINCTSLGYFAPSFMQ